MYTFKKLELFNELTSLFHANNISENDKNMKVMSARPVISRYHRYQKWTSHLRPTTNSPHKSNHKTNSWESFREPQEAPRGFPRPSQDPSISSGPSEPTGTSRTPHGPNILKQKQLVVFFWYFCYFKYVTYMGTGRLGSTSRTQTWKKTRTARPPFAECLAYAKSLIWK